MMCRYRTGVIALTLLAASSAGVSAADQVKTANGVVEGAEENGVRAFKGIPFAAPPVGDLRWKPPQPVQNWTGVRQATQFGPRCMQRAVFGDMNFRSERHERGLPVPERVDAREVAERAAAGARLLLRRRLHGRRRLRAALRRVQRWRARASWR